LIRIFLIFLLISFSLFAETILLKSVKVKGSILDFVVRDDRIYFATDKSKVLVYDKDLNKLEEIKVRKIKNFLDELIDSDIYSVDEIDKKVLLLAQAEDGYSELFIFKNGKLEKVLDKSLKLYAKAAKFIDKNRVLLALMSDDVVIFDINLKKIICKKSVGEYFFSTMAIDATRTRAVIGDEGGEVVVVNTKKCDIEKRFVDINKDKILALYIANNLVAAGGRDKKLVIYNLDNKSYKFLKGEFFVYVTSISPGGTLVAYADNEKYDIKVVEYPTFNRISILSGHKNIINKIIFLDENILISVSEGGEIYKWRLK